MKMMMIIITIPVLLSRICSYLYDNGMAAFTTNQYVKRNMFSSTSTNLNCHVNEVKLLAQGKLILFDLMSPLMFYTFLCTRLLPNLTACYTTYLTELWLKYKYEHFLFWGQCTHKKYSYMMFSSTTPVIHSCKQKVQNFLLTLFILPRCYYDFAKCFFEQQNASVQCVRIHTNSLMNFVYIISGNSAEKVQLCCCGE